MQQYVGAVPNESMEQREKIAEYWGLDKPPLERFFSVAGSILHGDFGTSLGIYRRPVLDIIGEKFWHSLALMLTAWAFSGILGFTIGCIMGNFHGKWPDKILKKLCLTMCSIPTFWIGIVFLMLFFGAAGLVPPHGYERPRGCRRSGPPSAADSSPNPSCPHAELLSFANIALHTRKKLVDVLKAIMCCLRGPGESRFQVLRRMGCGTSCCLQSPCSSAPSASCSAGLVLAENVFSHLAWGRGPPREWGRTFPFWHHPAAAVFVFVGNLLCQYHLFHCGSADQGRLRP